MHSLVASTDTPAAAAGGGTAALLQNTALLDYAGFAVTAKPSVNLLVLLQVRLQLVTLCLPIWRHYMCLQAFWSVLFCQLCTVWSDYFSLIMCLVHFHCSRHP